MLELGLAFAVLIPTAFGGLLLWTGLRTGDRAGEARIVSVQHTQAGLLLAITNPASHAVLVGASVRLASWRVRIEGGLHARIPRHTTRPELLPQHQTVVVVIEPHETAIVLVPVPAELGRRAQAVVLLGQSGRLRVLYRCVLLPQNHGNSCGSGRRDGATDQHTTAGARDWNAASER